MECVSLKMRHSRDDSQTRQSIAGADNVLIINDLQSSGDRNAKFAGAQPKIRHLEPIKVFMIERG